VVGKCGKTPRRETGLNTMKQYIVVYKSNYAVNVALPATHNVENDFSRDCRCIIDVEENRITFDGAHWSDISFEAFL